MTEIARKSVTNVVAKAMGLILILSLSTTSFAIVMLASTMNDAEAINVAGSMRMQSYRLSHDIQMPSDHFERHIVIFEQSLFSPSMKSLCSWISPKDIAQDYEHLVKRWSQLKIVLTGYNRTQYLYEVEGFVKQIDAFVVKLQHFSEWKLAALAWVGSLGLGSILVVSILLIHYVRKHIVKPLGILVKASEEVQSHSFNVSLHVASGNEIGVLTHTFNNMSAELGKLYHGLELAVDEKTSKLQRANKSLQVLYCCSQELAASRITHNNFSNILSQFITIEGIESARLEIVELGEKSLIIEAGIDSSYSAHSTSSPLCMDGHKLGTLFWKVTLPCPDPDLINSFVQLLSRAIYYNQSQRQAEQLLLMEERNAIARELHDSLAQALSYLKIQVSILKRQIHQFPKSELCDESKLTLGELDTGLSSAYVHLRELLTTFRLTISTKSFGCALQEVVQQMSKQTQSRIELNNELSSIQLDAHQQVHLLQIIREAITNAIKHAEASKISIHCYEDSSNVKVKVKDNGVGFDYSTDKAHHYGLNIIRERALCLHGSVDINTVNGEGCEVLLSYPKAKEEKVDEI